jgi:hypothetical protein
VNAWRVAVGSDIKDAANLGQREAGGLGSLDEADPLDAVLIIDAVAVGLPVCRGEELASFVEPDGLGSDPTLACEFTDSHPESLPLDLVPWFKVYGRGVDVTLLYFDDCPNWEDTARHLRHLADELGDIVVKHQLVDSPEEAERTRFRGSPSVIVDGVDPFADPEAPVGLSCRIYQTPGGSAGSPTLDQLRAVLTAARS